MSLRYSCELSLPHWLESFVNDWPDPLETAEQRMLLAVSLSAENVLQGTGGPFGAIVVEAETGRLISVGVNLVTTVELSIAHAEIVAISMAQSAINNWNLGHATEVQLVTPVNSCEPCAMCFGHVLWRSALVRCEQPGVGRKQRRRRNGRIRRRRQACQLGELTGKPRKEGAYGHTLTCSEKRLLPC